MVCERSVATCCVGPTPRGDPATPVELPFNGMVEFPGRMCECARVGGGVPMGDLVGWCLCGGMGWSAGGMVASVGGVTTLVAVCVWWACGVPGG